MKTKAEVLRHFDRFAVDGRWTALYDTDGDAAANYSFIARRRRVEQMLEPVIRPGCRVLDVGCGTGVMCEFAARRGARYLGIDLSGRMIDEARRGALRIGSSAADAEFRVGDVEDLDCPDGGFGVVLALGLFEYLDDPNAAADQLVRVAAPGATLVVSVPNARCVDATMDRFLSPLLTGGMRAIRALAGAPADTRPFFHRKFTPRRLDAIFGDRGCRCAARAYYNVELAAYPLRRIAPTLAWRLKRLAEPRADRLLRTFATGYIGQYVLDGSDSPECPIPRSSVDPTVRKAKSGSLMALSK